MKDQNHENDVVGESDAAQPKKKNISIKRARFVDHYIQNGGNVTRAASDAGFRSPRQQGSRLLTFVDIQDRIRQRTEEAWSLTNLKVIGTLASQMRADITDLLDENGKPDLAAMRDSNLGHLVKD